MEPRWLEVAYQEMRRGVREVPGGLHNDRILEYHASTTLKATTDEVPWCAAFVGWCLEEAEVRSTRSASARSYLAWGVPVSAVHIPVGAVVVIKRGGPNQPGPEVVAAQGHVGFFWGHGTPGHIVLLGGNQSNEVGLATYPVSRMLGVRWPKE